MKEIFNYRYYVLLALVATASTLFFAGCEEEDIAVWTMFHITNKMIAILLFSLTARLIDHWNPKGKIDALAKMMRKIENLSR